MIPQPDAALVQWAQVLSSVIAALAAVAAWLSATASRKTAGRADETARRAREALSRTIRPEFSGAISHTREAACEPQPMRLYLFNRTEHPGRVHSARVETPDGRILADVRNLSVPVGGFLEGSQPSITVPLGVMARARPDLRRGDGQAAEITLQWTIEYTDAGDLATWRQQGRCAEAVRYVDGSDDPIYRYDDQGSSVPELVTERDRSR